MENGQPNIQNMLHESLLRGDYQASLSYLTDIELLVRKRDHFFSLPFFYGRSLLNPPPIFPLSV